MCTTPYKEAVGNSILFLVKFRQNENIYILSQIPWNFEKIAKKSRGFELVSPNLEALLPWVAK
jgi:hypothetical protein